MNEEILKAYRKARRETMFLSARGALQQARQEMHPPQREKLTWQDCNTHNIIKIASIQREEMTIGISVEYDLDHDFTDNRGTFVRADQMGAIPYPPARTDHTLMGWFIPETTVAEHREALTKMGLSRSEAEEQARQYVLQDMLIAGNPEGQGCMSYGVIAKALYRGVELAEASLWGIEISDHAYSNDPYIETIALEVVEDAIYTAKKKLAELREP